MKYYKYNGDQTCPNLLSSHVNYIIVDTGRWLVAAFYDTKPMETPLFYTNDSFYPWGELRDAKLFSYWDARILAEKVGGIEMQLPTASVLFDN